MTLRTMFVKVAPNSKELLSKKDINDIIRRQASEIANVVPNDGAIIVLNTDRNNPAYCNILTRNLFKLGVDTVDNYVVIENVNGKPKISIPPVMNDAEGRTVIVTMHDYNTTKKQELDLLIQFLAERKVRNAYLAVFLSAQREGLAFVPNFVGYHSPVDVELLRGYGFGLTEERHLRSIRIPSDISVQTKSTNRTTEDDQPVLSQRHYRLTSEFTLKLQETDSLIASSTVLLSSQEIKAGIQKSVPELLNSVIKGRPFVLLIMQKGGSQFATAVRNELSYHDTPPYKVCSFHNTSYGETMHSGKLIVLDEGSDELKDQVVIVCDDIIDTAKAMANATESCRKKQAAETHAFALAIKKLPLPKGEERVPIIADSITTIFEVEGYVTGYGLDVGVGKSRACKNIMVVHTKHEEEASPRSPLMR